MKKEKKKIVKMLKEYGYELYDDSKCGLCFRSEDKMGDKYFISITNDNIEFGLNNAYFWFDRKDMEKILKFMKTLKKIKKISDKELKDSLDSLDSSIFDGPDPFK